ncbi:uncharacterized protein PHALS_05255 [Plasmopara halstedii]|uniref:Uncharacterized protein n=1 Tax=Plasmopara halstedii TaxID=4781 RepID=A0A0P1B165_PLAHL|nr:uncharacterized protein PHALS_05255 [Plasmopara halstedii]CEG47932.1 hypothetical protein PHALS_05255 [Plasmopara halstedii]|eukprot:XP_024584301.1 hypothetical protein PHALS_05255 [Plasmopara halstedii]
MKSKLPTGAQMPGDSLSTLNVAHLEEDLTIENFGRSGNLEISSTTPSSGVISMDI